MYKADSASWPTLVRSPGYGWVALLTRYISSMVPDVLPSQLGGLSIGPDSHPNSFTTFDTFPPSERGVLACLSHFLDFV